MRLICVLGFLALVGVCAAHLCLVDPPQRGGYGSGLTHAASNECLVVQAPCGTTGKGAIQATYQKGQTEQVIFQKNANHFSSDSPGYYEVNLLHGAGTTQLARVDDKDEASLTNITVSVNIPATLHNGDYVLQVIYVTNDQHGSLYYQCADVRVH